MTTYYKLDHSEPGYLSQMLPRTDGTWVKRADYYADLAAARAEIDRLRTALTKINVGDGWAAQIARSALSSTGEKG